MFETTTCLFHSSTNSDVSKQLCQAFHFGWTLEFLQVPKVLTRYLHNRRARSLRCIRVCLISTAFSVNAVKAEILCRQNRLVKNGSRRIKHDEAAMRPGGRGAPRSRPRGRGGLRGSSASPDATPAASRGARTVHFSSQASNSARSAATPPTRGSNSVLRQALRGAVQSKSDRQAQTATDRTPKQAISSQGSFQERYQQVRNSIRITDVKEST